MCYTLRGKHIHGMMNMGKVIVWLLRGKLYTWHNVYRKKSGMLRLGNITLVVQKMK